MQSMEFSRPEYWSGQPFPSPGSLSNPGIKPESPALQANSLPSEPQGKPYPYINPCNCYTCQIFTSLQNFPWYSFAVNPILSFPSQVSIYLTPNHRLVLPVLELCMKGVTLFIVFILGLCCATCGILVPRPGIEPASAAVECSES